MANLFDEDDLSSGYGKNCTVSYDDDEGHGSAWPQACRLQSLLPPLAYLIFLLGNAKWRGVGTGEVG